MRWKLCSFIPSVSRISLFPMAALVIFYPLFAFLSYRQKPPCPIVWSHRAHLDATVKNQNWTCAYALAQLHKNAIDHFDLDVLWYQDQLLVAHPSEIFGSGDPTTISVSPCSKLTLQKFQALLTNEYHHFYVVFEPKADWNRYHQQKQGDHQTSQTQPSSTFFLSDPVVLLEHLATFMETDRVTLSSHCGILFQHWQTQHPFQQLAARLQNHCDFVLPFRGNDVHLWHIQDNINSLSDSFYKIVMPPIQWFQPRSSDSESLMRHIISRGLDVAAWTVDDKEQLDQAVDHKIHHVITNVPLKVRNMLQQNQKCKSL